MTRAESLQREPKTNNSVRQRYKKLDVKTWPCLTQSIKRKFYIMMKNLRQHALIISTVILVATATSACDKISSATSTLAAGVSVDNVLEVAVHPGISNKLSMENFKNKGGLDFESSWKGFQVVYLESQSELDGKLKTVALRLQKSSPGRKLASFENLQNAMSSFCGAKWNINEIGMWQENSTEGTSCSAGIDRDTVLVILSKAKAKIPPDETVRKLSDGVIVLAAVPASPSPQATLVQVTPSRASTESSLKQISVIGNVATGQGNYEFFTPETGLGYGFDPEDEIGKQIFAVCPIPVSCVLTGTIRTRDNRLVAVTKIQAKEPVDLQRSSPTNNAKTVDANQSNNKSWTPSFDCQKVLNGAERLICSSKALSQADVEMAQIYRIARSRVTDTKALRLAQIEWRRSSRDACADSNCMLEAYRARSAELRLIQ
jgi:Lysozyme inhibitor LprI